MPTSLNRRTFLQTAVAAGSTLAAPAALAAMLQGPDAASKVYDILATHLGLLDSVQPANLRALASAFTISLSQTHGHRRSGAEFQAAVNGTSPAAAEDLALYVVQEFVVATNYAAHLDNAQIPLRLLDAAHAGPLA